MDKTVSAKVTEGDAERLEQIAASRGESVSSFVRNVLRRELDGGAKEETPDAVFKDLLSSGLGELKAEIRDLKWALFNAQGGAITARDRTPEREPAEPASGRTPYPENVPDLKTGWRERLAPWWARQSFGIRAGLLAGGIGGAVFLVVLAIGDLRAPKPSLLSSLPPPVTMLPCPRLPHRPPLHSGPYGGHPVRQGRTPGTGIQRPPSPPALLGWRVIGVSGTGAVLVDPSGQDHLVRKGREIQGVSVTGIDPKTGAVAFSDGEVLKP